MSASKSVTYGDRGFWAYDIVLGVFLKYLIDVVEDKGQANTPFLAEVIASWRLAPIYDFGLNLKESWVGLQKQNVIAFAEEACERLAVRESIPKAEIVSWSTFGDQHLFHRGLEEVRTAVVIELGKSIIALLRDELPEPPKGQAWFFTDAGRSTIPMDPSWNGKRGQES